MKNINLALEDAQHERLRLAAFEDRKPMSQIIREAIDRWLAERERGKQ